MLNLIGIRVSLGSNRINLGVVTKTICKNTYRSISFCPNAKVYTKSGVLDKKFCLSSKFFPSGFSKNLTRNLSINKLHSSQSKIYTKTGDGGTTSLFTGERRAKDDTFFVALGTVDELSSNIGLAKEFALEKQHDYVEQLERIQCILQDIGTIIATPVPKTDGEQNAEREKRIRERMGFNKRHVDELEGWIDTYTSELPPLTNFILPGGGRAGAALHVCRTVCRRAERSIVPLIQQDLIDNKVLIYINRLSDYLFTISRHATILDGKKETIYIHPKHARGSSSKKSENNLENDDKK